MHCKKKNQSKSSQLNAMKENLKEQNIRLVKKCESLTIWSADISKPLLVIAEIIFPVRPKERD